VAETSLVDATRRRPSCVASGGLLEACKRYRDKDDRVQTHEYEDIVHSQLTVRAFYRSTCSRSIRRPVDGAAL